MKFKEKIDLLASELSINEVKLNNNKHIQFTINGKYYVDIEEIGEDGFTISAEAANLPTIDREDYLIDMLATNIVAYRENGIFLSFDRNRDTAVLCRRHDGPSNFEEFARDLGIFLDCLLDWNVHLTSNRRNIASGSEYVADENAVRV